MTDLGKMALELLAAELERSGAATEAVESLRHADLVSPAIAVSTRAIRTALLTAPPGWKLVPVEPTPLMVATFRADNANGAMSWMTHTTLRCADFSSRYAGMIAAAPEVK